MLRRYAAVALLLCALLLPNYALAQQPAARPTPVPAPTSDAAKPTAPQVAQAASQQNPAKDPNDPIERIKDEGLNRSQVMQTLSYLTDVIGPRLTASPNMKRANEWTRDQMAKWGLQNAHLEAWGPFGRGWSLKSFSAQVLEPQGIPLIAFLKAWSPGVNITSSEVLYVDAKDESGLQKFKGQLRGKIVVTSPVREVKAHFEPLGARMTEKDLLRLADAPEPGSPQGRRAQLAMLNNPQAQEFIKNAVADVKRLKFFVAEGVGLLLEPSRAGDGGTIFVQSVNLPQQLDESSPIATIRSLFMGRVQPYNKNAPQTVPQIVVAVEHYNRILRLIQAGEKVQVSVNADVQFHDDDSMGYNTIAEIPGSDLKLKDEVVMLGAHMDSWHAGTGATDNGAGCAVVMEAARILKALNLQPRRTVRVALWSGEEQGLLGSRAYVAQHFGKVEESEDASFMRMAGMSSTPPKIVPGPELGKLAGYFNLDNGTGKVRGVYLQGNEAVRPIFRQWLAPFREMGAATLSIANTGGTDHLSFDAIGLPGFQFIQDTIEYETRTHHSNMDVFDRIQADDMKQAATIMAAFVYNTAMRDEKLPHKPMPTAAPTATSSR